MTLVRTDGDGYKVISDIGKEYVLYEMVCMGTPTPKTSDIIAIMHWDSAEGPTPTFVDYFFGAMKFEDEIDQNSLDLIRNIIRKFENKNFKDHSLLEGDIIASF